MSVLAASYQIRRINTSRRFFSLNPFFAPILVFAGKHKLCDDGLCLDSDKHVHKTFVAFLLIPLDKFHISYQ